MQRDSSFDNYKGFLIILVLVGHFIGPLTEKSYFANFLETAIYSFHMPAFIFISGFFSKRNSFVKLVKTIFVPYVVFQIIYFFFSNAIWDKANDFQLFDSAFSLWFLLSLFCWRVLIDKVIKVKGIIFLLFLIGILVGFDTSIGTFASLGRTITFFPYFVLGHKFDKEKFMKLADRKAVKILSALLLLAAFTIIFITCENIDFDILTIKHSYEKIGFPQWGWLYRMSLYLASTVLILLFATIIPRRRHWYSYLGQRTMSIYLLHGIVFKTIEYRTNIYDSIDTNGEVMLIVLFAVVLSFLLSLKPFDYCIKEISLIPVEKLLSIKENS